MARSTPCRLTSIRLPNRSYRQDGLPPRRRIDLRIEHVASERLGWELFRGHLLDPAHARQQFCFAAWNVYLDTASATVRLPGRR